MHQKEVATQMNGKAGCPLGDWYYQGEGGWASQPKTPMSNSESDCYDKLNSLGICQGELN